MADVHGLCLMIRCLSCRKLTKQYAEHFLQWFGPAAKVRDIQPRLKCSCGSKETAIQVMPWWMARHPQWDKWMQASQKSDHAADYPGARAHDSSNKNSGKGTPGVG